MRVRRCGDIDTISRRRKCQYYSNHKRGNGVRPCCVIDWRWPRHLCDWNSWLGHPLRKFDHDSPNSMNRVKTIMNARHLSVAALLLPGVVACAISANAAETWTETWTCTYSTAFDNRPTVARFEVLPPDLIETNFRQTYRIETNNDYGLIAISAISKIEQGHKEPTVGAVSVVINKMTGEFWWVSAITAGQPAAVNQPAHGKCIKD